MAAVVYRVRWIKVEVWWLQMETCMNIGRVFIILSAFSSTWAEKCENYSLSIPYNGRFCTGGGVVTQLGTPHLCRYQCILLATCNAYNYNATTGTCTHFSSPCPQALGDPTMEFAVFTQRPYEQCYEWIPYYSGDYVDERMAHTEHSYRIISRTQRSGNDIVVYFEIRFSQCYGYFGSHFSTLQCQRLRIMEDCTTYWVTYVARDPLPPRAVTAGHMANGDRVYVSKFDVGNGELMGLPGHYVAGAENTVTEYKAVARRSNIMMIMVVL